ncbi:MAG TPA: hypothetical protein VNO23_17240 [Candidatus Binatia bacterium]|nr:hypothetical protein [Candidatus Binatia bacterium]
MAIAVAVGLTATGLAHAGAQDTANGIVPLPGSLVLLGAGVAGLAGVSWWLRRK